MAGRRKAAHVAGDFRKDDRRAQNADAGDRAEKVDQGSKGRLTLLGLLVHARDRGVDLLIDFRDGRLQRVVLFQVQPKQEGRKRW